MNMTDADSLLLRRYMAGQLNTDEERNFEQRLLSDPSFANAAYAEQKLSDAIKAHDWSMEAIAPASQPHHRRRWAVGLGLAASIAMACVAAWLFIVNRGLEQQIAELRAPSGNGQLVLLQTLRDSESVPRVDRSVDTETVVFLVSVAQAAESYVFTLTQGNDTIRLAPLRPGAQNWLSVLVPGRALKVGAATITVAPMTQSGEPQRFDIQIR